jgi:predicted negative regulator of RcsB-dependent stress response
MFIKGLDMKNKKILILALVIIASIIVFGYNINQNISN